MFADKFVTSLSFLTANLGWKLVSLAIAVAVWLTVASEPEMSTVISVPVEYKESPANLEISNRIVDSVDLELRGPAGRLSDVRASHLAVILDFSRVLNPGERTFTIAQNNTNLPRGMRLVRAIPAQVRFEFEHRATRRVPVRIHYTGELPPGLRLADVRASPDTLRIIGPETRVGKVDELTTDPVYLNSVTGNADLHVATFVGEPQVRFIDYPEISVKLRVAKSDTLK